MKRLRHYFLIFVYLTFMSFNPTGAQESMSNTNVSSSQKTKLEQFIGSKKFVAEKLYPGAVNEIDRVKFEAEVIIWPHAC